MRQLPLPSLCFPAALLLALTATSCGGDEGPAALNVAWTFDSGDCASNGVEKVRVVWTPAGGTSQQKEFDCTDGGGELGEFPDGGTVAIDAEALDADGIARAESFGQAVSFGPGGTGGIPVDITLHPSPADIVVSWGIAGGGSCPQGIILPYFITLYRAPAEDGGELTAKVADVQESCSSGQATLSRVAPGTYVVEVDSRAVTPALRGTAPVTVEPGVPAQVAVEL